MLLILALISWFCFCVFHYRRFGLCRNYSTFLCKNQTTALSPTHRHPWVPVTSKTHNKQTYALLPTNNVYLQPVAMECHCLSFPWDWITKDGAQMVISFLTGAEVRGSQEHPGQQKLTGTPSSTGHPPQNKRPSSRDTYHSLLKT